MKTTELIGIVIAMESELKPYLDRANGEYTSETFGGKTFYRMRVGEKDVVVTFSGIGKVNAAYATTLLCYRYDPTFVISTGVSGGLGRSKVLEAVVATATCQHDSDTSPLGDPVGLVSTVNKIYFETDKALSEKFARILHAKQGVVACGDQFIADKRRAEKIVSLFDAVACDMESGAIGHVCYMQNKPFVVIRCISDGADGDAGLSFTQIVDQAALKLCDAVTKALATL